MYHDELVQVTQTVWESMLRSELVPTDSERLPAQEDLTASVDITGSWHGSVVASCNEQLARELAAVLLRSEPAQLRPEHVRDALAEIANMLGGSIKALFPAPCKLSLPSVSTWSEASVTASRELLERVSFDCRGGTLSVELRGAAGG